MNDVGTITIHNPEVEEKFQRELAEWVEGFNTAEHSPVGRLRAVQDAVSSGLITEYQGLKLLDIDTSAIDAEFKKVERAMRVSAATNPLLGGTMRVVDGGAP